MTLYTSYTTEESLNISLNPTAVAFIPNTPQNIHTQQTPMYAPINDWASAVTSFHRPAQNTFNYSGNGSQQYINSQNMNNNHINITPGDNNSTMNATFIDNFAVNNYTVNQFTSTSSACSSNSFCSMPNSTPVPLSAPVQTQYDSSSNNLLQTKFSMCMY